MRGMGGVRSKEEEGDGREMWEDDLGVGVHHNVAT
jgi:hypothetical protein